jgi:hypothetical protein
VIIALSTQKERTGYATDILKFEAYLFVCLLPDTINFIISVVRRRLIYLPEIVKRKCAIKYWYLRKISPAK